MSWYVAQGTCQYNTKISSIFYHHSSHIGHNLSTFFHQYFGFSLKGTKRLMNCDFFQSIHFKICHAIRMGVLQL
jgi:hypothetical protein